MNTRNLLVALAIVTLPLSVWAQEADKYTREDGIRSRFVLRVGGYFPSHDTFVRLQPNDRPEVPGFDLETDTGFADSTTDFRAELDFKLGRRHLLRLGYVDMNRKTATTLRGEITWGDEVFPIDAEINGNWDTRVLKFDYRYAVIKTERVDFGLSLGVFLMRVTSSFTLAGEARGTAEDVRKTAPLPMLGGDVEWLFADRWLLRAGAQYLAISIDETIDGSWLEARAAVEWSAASHFGIGGGYLLADIDVAAQLTDAALSEFEYRYNFNGPFLYVFANF